MLFLSLHSGDEYYNRHEKHVMVIDLAVSWQRREDGKIE